MRIVFFGIPDMGVICLKFLAANKKNIVAIVPPAMIHPAHCLMVNTASSLGIPCLAFNKSPKEKEFIEKFKKLAPDVAVVASFNNLIPSEVLNIPQLGFINCHPSLLPEYRGGNPYFHVILNDEKYTGTTLHYMDEGFDTGDIIIQEEITIDSGDTLGLLFNKLNFQGASMLNDILTRLENGEKLLRIPQDKVKKYKTAPNIGIDEETTFINWSKDAFYIERFVRALNPFFGAKSYYRKHKIRFWSGKYDLSFKTHQAPGTIVKVNENGIAIATGKGVFIPKTLQIEYLIITEIKDFISRTAPQIGEVFYPCLC